MDVQVSEKLVQDEAQSAEKTDTITDTIKAKYHNLAEAIKFLQQQNKIRYLPSDLFNLIFSGELTPYFPYHGVLIRVDSRNSPFQNIFRGLVKLNGYITPFNQATLEAMQYASSEVHVSFKDVVIAKDFVTLQVDRDLTGEYGLPVWDDFSESYEDVSYYTIADEINEENRKEQNNSDDVWLPSQKFSNRLEDCVFYIDDLTEFKQASQTLVSNIQLIDDQKAKHIVELEAENAHLKTQLDDLKKSQDFMACCDSKHEYYAPELHHVIKIWSHLYVENGRKIRHSHTQDVQSWINKNIGPTNDDLSDIRRKRYVSITTPEVDKNKTKNKTDK